MSKHRRRSALAEVDGLLRDLEVQIAEDAGDPEPYVGQHRDDTPEALARDLIGAAR